MKKIELLKLIEREIREYRLMDRGFDRKTIDPLLVDFLNFVAAGQGINYGMKVEYLSDDYCKDCLMIYYNCLCPHED